jgi:sodium pump decarboxylase gamma subunit
VLLVAGMGIVFLFLLLLVFVMSHSSKLVVRFNHILPDDEPKKKSRPAATVKSDDTAVAIAVAVAVAQAR